MNLGAPCGLMPDVCCATGVLLLKGQVRGGENFLVGAPWMRGVEMKAL